MRRQFGITLVTALASVCLVEAQPPRVLVDEAGFQWSVVRNNLLKMAEKMPAAEYSFKPTPEIETFAQRVAHIARSNLNVCEGIMKGQAPSKSTAPPPVVTTKPELVALMKQASASCDAAFNSLNDTTAMEKISSQFGGPFPPNPTRTKLATLYNMLRHSNEVYGYMCVYLRLKGIVPPSSAPE
jgi:hypothetical protein